MTLNKRLDFPLQQILNECHSLTKNEQGDNKDNWKRGGKTMKKGERFGGNL
jgi:hypothetical protein